MVNLIDSSSNLLLQRMHLFCLLSKEKLFNNLQDLHRTEVLKVLTKP